MESRDANSHSRGLDEAERRPPEPSFMEERQIRGPSDLSGDVHAGPGGARPGDVLAYPSSMIEPPSVPDGTFVKVLPQAHPLPPACEVVVYLQDYHRSSSKLGRFGKIVGIDVDGGEYLVMLDNFESLAVPMRRAEWRKVAT